MDNFTGRFYKQTDRSDWNLKCFIGCCIFITLYESADCIKAATWVEIWEYVMVDTLYRPIRPVGKEMAHEKYKKTLQHM